MKFVISTLAIAVVAPLACWAEIGFVATDQPQQSASSTFNQSEVQACLDKERMPTKSNQKEKPAPKQEITFHQVNPSELPQDCESGNLQSLKQALTNQLADCKKTRTITSCDKRQPARLPNAQFGCKLFTRNEWCLQTTQKMLDLLEPYGDLSKLNKTQMKSAFNEFMNRTRTELDWYKNDGRTEDTTDHKIKKGDVQFTAYYAPPAMASSSTRSEAFAYPLYKSPPNLVHLSRCDDSNCGRDPLTGHIRKTCLKTPDGKYVPVPERREIDSGHVLEGQGLEIAYLKSPVDIAFLMVEGSGAINLNGKMVHINYDSDNGRTRYMLGRVIKCVLKCEDEPDGKTVCQDGSPADYSSEKGIRNYLAAHPEHMFDILNMDQSYVFFDSSSKGPFGADGIPVTAGESFATDRSSIPTGTLMMYSTSLPGKPSGKCKTISSLALSQDSGGAIGGAHVDQYYGEGARAKKLADDVNAPGSLFVAVPKGSGTPIPNCTETGRSTASAH